MILVDYFIQIYRSRYVSPFSLFLSILSSFTSLFNKEKNGKKKEKKAKTGGKEGTVIVFSSRWGHV
jgi:hypothetical protein